MTTETTFQQDHVVSPGGSMIAGFRPRTPTVRVEPNLDLFPMLAPADGAESLWAEIDDITFEEKTWIPALTAETMYADIWREIWPYIRAWNVLGRNRETKQFEPLPPPAEAGPEVFSSVQPMIIAGWLAHELKFGHLRNRALDEKKESTSSERGRKSDTDSDSSEQPSSPTSRRRKTAG